MSNRVRILLALPGGNVSKSPLIFIGKSALVRLEELYMAAPSIAQVAQPQHVYIGGEGNLRSQVTLGPANKRVPLNCPENVSVWKRSVWYWQHLHAAYKEGAAFVVTREGRNYPWGRSEANPVRAGMAMLRKVPKPKFRKLTTLQAVEADSDVWKPASIYGKHSPYDEPAGLSFQATLERDGVIPKRGKRKKLDASSKPGLRVGIWA